MPQTRNPRRGSMQYWPRKRAKRIVARVRHVAKETKAKPLTFAGYKVGMTHVLAVENRPTNPLKGKPLFMPATIIECPPLKILGVNLYKNAYNGLTLSSTILSATLDKDLQRKLTLPKKYEKTLEGITTEGLADIRLIAYTQPKKTTIGKKKPELFELHIGGNTKEQLEYAKGVLNKELTIADVFSEGAQVDTHSISKGKGNQGPVKRFGVMIRRHKSEKTKRGPGVLGPWSGERTYRVAHAGQTGYHQRTEHNKWIIKIGKDKDANLVNPRGDWIRYGVIKNDYLILKGSLPGPSKRLITLTKAARPNLNTPSQAPQLKYIHTESKQ